mmetsp:Transcript_80328/g.152707  ORF Transcript_80328/g.152707 Transcript_80328/m.152707 type:complete len:82 (-) Transcript_80328:1044-1289(-)
MRAHVDLSTAGPSAIEWIVVAADLDSQCSADMDSQSNARECYGVFGQESTGGYSVFLRARARWSVWSDCIWFSGRTEAQDD